LSVARTPTKRRSKPSFRARLRTFWVLGAFLIAAGAYSLWLLVQAPWFRAQGIEVSGNLHVPSAQIVARAGLDPHANVWLLDTRAVERRVEAIPYVERARVSRGLPASVAVAVSERAVDGCVRGSGFAFAVDAAQRVLQAGCHGGPTYELPKLATEPPPGRFLNDATLTELQGDAHALAAAGRHLTDFSLDSFGQLEAVMPGGIRVRFGSDDDLSRKERLIDPILTALGVRVAGVVAIDLRAPGTPVVEHRATLRPANGRAGRNLSTPK
jgi:cell division protein FtsQ